MIPIRDDNPCTRVPVVTWALVAACVGVFLLQQSEPDAPLGSMVVDWAMVPARVTDPDAPRVQAWSTLLTCTFLHGSWLHLIGNVWTLFIFGDNVEERFGRLGYLLFYVVCGVAASAAHLLADPSSTVPTVGASGAIAGVMGAYFLLYPRSRVLTLIPLGFILQTVVMPASVFLGLWIVIQIVNATFVSPGAGGVAWWAHIGGFALGVAVAGLLSLVGALRAPPAHVVLQAMRYGRR